VKEVCDKVGARLFELARQVDNSPLANAKFEDMTLADGHVRLRNDSTRAVSFADAMRHGKLDVIEEEASTAGSAKQRTTREMPTRRCSQKCTSTATLGTIQVRRVVSAVAAGRIPEPENRAKPVARRSRLGHRPWHSKKRASSIMRSDES